MTIAPPRPSSPAPRQPRRGWLPGVLLSCLLFFGLGGGAALALDPATGLQQYNQQTWSRRNGLPVRGITAIAQTRDGYLWFGSSAGIVRFDGLDFQRHDFHSVASIGNSVVTCLAPSRDGGLWVGLENSSFGFYDGRSLSFYGEKFPETKKLNVRSLLESRDGTLWLGIQGLAARLGPARQWEPALTTDPATGMSLNMSCVHEGRNRLWFGTYSQGVYFRQDGRFTRIPDPELDRLTVRCLAEDADGKIWIGAQEGLRCYDANLQRQEIPPFGMEIRALLADRQGVLWIGTSGHGLIRQRQGIYDTLLSTRDTTDGDYVQALAEDHEGSLWVGTREGVSQISDVKFPIQPAAGDPAIKDAFSVGASHGGGVWIASSGGVARFEPKTKSYWTLAGLPNPYAKRVFEAANSDVYVVSGHRRLAVFVGGKIAAMYEASSMVVGMAEDAEGVVVSVGGELYRAGPTVFRPYEFKDSARPDFGWILNLAPGRDGSIWVASVNGIFRVKDGHYRRWAEPEGLSDPGIMWICEDPEGVVWAGLLSGLARLKDDRIHLISRKDGLFDDNIYAAVPDDLGNLWVDTGSGIFRASRRDLNDFADGKIPRVPCTVFDGTESVKVVDKNNQERFGCKTADGRIWFPGPRGVVMIDPAHVPVNRTPPPVHIASLRANRQEIDRKHAIVPPGEGKGGLEFHYDALSFIAPQKTKFRYQLLGYDKAWVEADDRRMAFYTNLRPGRYTFRVIAANSDGIWNEKGDSLELELRPLFSETIWFYLLCGVLALSALAGIYLWRVSQLTHRQQALQKSRDLLETEVQNRTAELAKTNHTLRQEIEERSRMQTEIASIHKQLLEQSRQAGMAEVATSVLHNVGNVLNSINVSSTLVSDLVRRSKTANVGKVSDLLAQHRAELGPYLTEDAKGRMIPAYLANLAESLTAEQKTIVGELEGLQKNINHVKDIVAMQQSYAKTSGVTETISVPDLVEDALRMNAGSLARHEVDIARDYAGRPVITVEKNKVLQILVNLIRNAKYACDESGRTDKLITLRTTTDSRGVVIAVIDNGVGIPPENLTRIFSHGFTTRKHGHGFGLHSGALAAKELGGSLTVRSDGPGKGATFILQLPFSPDPLSP